MAKDQPSEQQDAPTLAEVICSDVKLIHFTDRKIEKLHSRESQKIEYKPEGFWFSVEGNGDGWKDWCEKENFELHRFALAYEVVLSDKANIVYLSSASDIDWFHEKYAAKMHPSVNLKVIDWAKVAGDYKGIVITPYIWSRRLQGQASRWYYSWDCACGCIWDTSAIEALEKMDI